MKTKYKLIISDLDRTLLPRRELPLSGELISLIKGLKEAGVYFAIASGRQYLNLYRLFYLVRDSVFFIPENGGWLAYKESTLLESEIAKNTAMSVIDEILSDRAGIRLLLIYLS